MTIRPATPADAEVILQLIHELAEYERAPEEAVPDLEALRRHLSPDACPRCEAFLAELDAGETAGFALFYHNYSTWKTNWGIYLEDLFVRPPHRGEGVGFALLQEVARVAVARGCVRMEWQVLNWNELALNFYEKLGARPLDDWTTMRLTGAALARLGS